MNKSACLPCLIVLSLATACASATRSRSWLAESAHDRTRHHIGPRSLETAPLPAGYTVADGLSPDEAVGVAVWRSPALQAELTAFDRAMADFDEARRPANPRLSFLAPVDPRQLALILTWPIDAIWQVPLRAAAANRELERVCESLVQIVLDLERDVRIAHAEARVAQARVRALETVAATWAEASTLAESRASIGEIAPTDAAAVRAEATIAADAVNRGRRDAEIAAARLSAIIAAPWPTLPTLIAPPSRAQPLADRDVLIARAYAQRPDLRATQLAIHVAGATASWERSRVFSLVASIDGQAPVGGGAPRISVGAQTELPLFSQNQGGVGRAEAAIARAGHLYAATRLTVAMEVKSARAATARAQASLDAYASVMRALEEASAGARQAFKDGAESYLFVVDAVRREAQARLRLLDLDAELARAEADLARAVGGQSKSESK